MRASLVRLASLSGSQVGRRSTAATGGRRTWSRMTDTQAAKRAKLVAEAAIAVPQAVLAAASDDVAAPAAGQQTTDAAPAADSHPAPKQQRQQQGGKKPKAVVMPTPVPPPHLPEDLTAWENAVLLIDKPKGWTSFDVCGKLRGALAGLLKLKPRNLKVGHAGTLDPMATGLLIVCVGRGTKAVDSFMAMHKEYSGTLRLGEGTETYDAESEVTERLPWEHITQEALLAARDSLTGSIEQLPPMHSAIRVGGKRLYEVARKGGEVERTPRSVTVDVFDVQRDAADPQNVHFSVTCSKGTYIRSLAYDLGHQLDSAAHLTALRREAIGEYRVDNAWQMDDLIAQISQRRQAAKAEKTGQQPAQQEAAEGAGAEPADEAAAAAQGQAV